MPVYRGRRPQTWRVTIFAQGKQHEWIVEGTKKDAATFEASKLIDLGSLPAARHRAIPSFYDFCTQTYEPHAERHLGTSTWNKVRVYQVATLAKHFGPTRLDAFRPELVEAYKTARLAQSTRHGTPMLASSINNELRVLKTML